MIIVKYIEFAYQLIKERLEDGKCVIRSRKLKDRQCNGFGACAPEWLVVPVTQ